VTGRQPDATTARAAAGSVVYRRRSALGLSLLDLSRQTGLPLLLLADIESGRASPPDRDPFVRVLRALGFAGPCDVLWRVASESREERPDAEPDAEPDERPRTFGTTAEAAQRFLYVARAAELGTRVRQPAPSGAP
jgi:transcriptional regulator with XRE-family HTH domain